MLFPSSQPTPIPEEKKVYLQILGSGETHISPDYARDGEREVV